METTTAITAADLAREVMTRHEREGRAHRWDGEKWVDTGPTKPWCSGEEHGEPSGGPWPCDAVRLARVVLDDPSAGGSDEPDSV